MMIVTYSSTLGDSAPYTHTHKFPLLLRLREVKSVARVLPTETGLEPARLQPQSCWREQLSRGGKAMNSPLLTLAFVTTEAFCPSPMILWNTGILFPVDMGHSDPPREQLGGGWHCPLCKRTMLLPRPFPLENSRQNNSSFPLSKFS